MRPGIARRLAIAAAVIALAVPVGAAVATPSQGLTVTPLGQGSFSQRLKVKAPNVKATFKRPSDFVVVDLRVDPGGTTGWHSHPGPALVVVKDGTLTLYDGDDRRCRPHRYGPGQAFVDGGGGHVHIARNETSHPVQVLVTFIVPKGADTFIDVPDPGNCRNGRRRTPLLDWLNLTGLRSPPAAAHAKGR
jgi:quercetin dioxygenase-like cupin family protein